MRMVLSPLPSFASLARGPMLTARRRQRRRNRAQRPPPHWFTIGTFRSLGRRLWNPPPSPGEEHYSWFISPKYRVSLQDVIDDKHPSPLSRQDFEDYLHYVEGSIASLYFHEWVHNYRRLHKEWAESVLPAATNGLSGSSKHLYPARELWERLKLCQDRELRDEFSDARAAFFQPRGSMLLSIDERLRDQVLSIPNLPPPQQLTDKLPSYPNQPEPSIFDPILEQVDKALEIALARFVKLAFCNAGLWHCCLGHLLGACILSAGLTLWCLGVTSRRRQYVAGSLPLIWIGVWFLLTTASGMCLGVYVTGDARQLYPWEVARSLPPGAVSPPTFSIAAVPNDTSTISSYSFGRKHSNTSPILPLATPPLQSPQSIYQPKANSGRRWSEGVLKIWGRHRKEMILRSADQRSPDRRDRVELDDLLPPARRTKNLPRTSLVLDVEQANRLTTTLLPTISVAPTPRAPTIDLSQTRRNAAVDLTSELEAAGFGPDERPDSPFTEENDFGIVVSDVFEADTPQEPFHRPAPWTTFSIPESNREEEVATRLEWKPNPPESLDRLAPLIQVPEPAVSRRRTMPDIYTPTTETLTVDHSNMSRRGSRSSELEPGREHYWPWPRTLLGPMTLVHSPLVRRAHWETIWRTAALATVVTCGMTLGLIR